MDPHLGLGVNPDASLSFLVLCHSLPLPFSGLYKAESLLSTGILCQMTGPGMGPGARSQDGLSLSYNVWDFWAQAWRVWEAEEDQEPSRDKNSSWDMRQQEQGAECAGGVSEQWIWLNQTWLPSGMASSPNKASRLLLEKNTCPSSGEHPAVLSLLLSNMQLDLKQLWKCHCQSVFVLVFGGGGPTQKTRRDLSRSLWL